MTPEHQNCSGFISSWTGCDLKNYRSATRKYFECFDARNFLHGFIHEKTTGKTDVKTLLLIRIITTACKIQVVYFQCGGACTHKLKIVARHVTKVAEKTLQTKGG
jgi:hypothetical protein